MPAVDKHAACGWALRSSVCTTRLILGLMINAVVLLASSRRLILGGPAISLGLTGKNLATVKVGANETYSEAKRQFSDRNNEHLLSAL